MMYWKYGISSSFFKGLKKGEQECQEDYFSVYGKDNRVLFAKADGIDDHSWEEKAFQWRIDLLKFRYFMT